MAVSNRVEVDPKLQNETCPRSADFTAKLQLGETISSCSCAASVYSGNAPTPSSLLNGVATFSGNVVTQSLTGGVLGCIYELKFSVVTSLSNTYNLTGYLAVVPDLP